VVLDVGTNNPGLRQDDLYLGWDHDRVRGNEYTSFVDKFANLVVKHQPQCLLHFEDFGVSNAQMLLERYKSKQAVFNDDIQGTGAVTLATLTAALQVTRSKLSDQRIVQFGAGSAGLGIVRQIRDAMVLVDGTDEKDASSKFWLVDKYGLVKKGLGDKVRSEIEPEFIRQEEDWGTDETHLLEVVKRVKPTVLIGTSTASGAFTEDVIREMAKHTDRPIIFPLSNPTKLAECKPEDAQRWTDGKALISTGSPFPPVDLGDGKKYTVAECNNALVYPGIGLGAILARAKRVTDKMIVRAAQVLGDMAPASADKPEASLLPDFAGESRWYRGLFAVFTFFVSDSQKVAEAIALEVMDQAIEEGVSDLKDEALLRDKEARKKYLEEKLWRPVYSEYEYDPEGHW
jgi:malate dehydrogenase (oxaloacetate-decarboxylating)